MNRWAEDCEKLVRPGGIPTLIRVSGIGVLPPVAFPAPAGVWAGNHQPVEQQGFSHERPDPAVVADRERAPYVTSHRPQYPRSATDAVGAFCVVVAEPWPLRLAGKVGRSCAEELVSRPRVDSNSTVCELFAVRVNSWQALERVSCHGPWPQSHFAPSSAPPSVALASWPPGGAAEPHARGLHPWMSGNRWHRSMWVAAPSTYGPSAV